MTRASILAFALLASLSLPSLARADVPPPNLAGCDMKKAGDACVKDDDSDGSCVQQKCSKLDYSNGTPPTSVEYDCLLCSGPPAAPNDTANDAAADDGCSVALPGVTASSMGAGAAIAAALLWMRRRRSSKKS
jgi:MYXO-CTERM domain-containing protein